MRIHDGAMGTLLQHHLAGDETVDDLCLREPALVRDVHAAYLAAGADTVQTNSFLAWMRDSERRRRDLLHSALECAREAVAAHGPVVGGAHAGSAPRVAATLGPAGDDPRLYWRDLEQVLEAGVQLVRCETVASRAVGDAVLAAWADVAAGAEAGLLLGCTVSPSRGADASRWVLELAQDAPAAVALGLNCCEGPLGLRPVFEALVEARADGAGAGTVWIDASAGLPSVDERGDTVWPLAEPEPWAEATARLVAGLPVAAAGGCCGTSPGSIAALVEALAAGAGD